ncbi:MAG: acyl-CoA dehydrogenase family protein [Hydrogenophaga sp.]
MNHYQPNTDDMFFLLQEVLRAPEQLQALSVFADADADLMRQVAEEADKFVGEVIAPMNRQGDEVGVQFKNGTVTTPPGFREAYQAFWQAGWPALSAAEADGGQGLPAVLEAMLYENLSAANHGWTMAPGLLHGAYECIKHHGSATLKARYLEKVATGEWLATMCLTEPHAGSDLGLVRTKAVPLANDPEGRCALNGTKIFISGGEHDLTDNIVHLVLARLPESPSGPKGLSLFLVPKFYDDGTRSAVVCERIEEKMGLHGSPTCVMRFDDAAAWIVGEPGKGLNAMFVMMNAARLHVGLQGIGLLEAAWQKASAYAKDRRQMRAPGTTAKAGQADLIELHPAVRRLLDTQRAWIDAGRVIAYRTALDLDTFKHHTDSARREAANRWCTLVTPVLKAAWTDQAFTGASACLQVFGGHGYVREWGIEQHVRDARVAMIYEGTNEIQAIDLLIRKVLPDGAQSLLTLLDELLADLPQGADTSVAAAALKRFAVFVHGPLLTATRSTDAPPDLPYWLADDFLRAFAVLLMAWSWDRIDQAPGAEAPRWRAARTAFWRWVWPEFEMRMAMMQSTLNGA